MDGKGTKEIFEKRVQELRKTKKKENGKPYTQKDLAEAINLNQSAVGNYESGINFCSMENAIKLAKFFDVSLEYLFGLSDIKKFDGSPKSHPNRPQMLGEIARAVINLSVLQGCSMAPAGESEQVSKYAEEKYGRYANGISFTFTEGSLFDFFAKYYHYMEMADHDCPDCNYDLFLKWFNDQLRRLDCVDVSDSVAIDKLRLEVQKLRLPKVRAERYLMKRFGNEIEVEWNGPDYSIHYNDISDAELKYFSEQGIVHYKELEESSPFRRKLMSETEQIY